LMKARKLLALLGLGAPLYINLVISFSLQEKRVFTFSLCLQSNGKVMAISSIHFFHFFILQAK
jgi:hypothetical protein